EVGADVCSALAAAHARGLIHRDVKPGNVMLTPQGVVKVMDFGIARATSSETITQTAAVVGTAQYISPEQAQGQVVDFRSDLYSLGCCLYEMLTGTVPFTGATPVAIAYRHVREDPTPPRRYSLDIPPALEAVCLKAMAKLPEDRYQTAAEMRQDLERVRAGWAPAAATLAAQRPPTDAAATTVLGATVAPSRAARHGEPPPRRGRRWLLWVLVPIGVLALTGLVAFLISKVVNPLPPVAGPTTFPVVTTSPPTRPPPTTKPPSTTAPTTTEAPTSSQQTSTSQHPLVQVPDVRGRLVEEARSILQQAGLRVRVISIRVQDPSQVGRVLDQSPAAGQTVPSGTVVNLAVGRRRG
ncbi:MAG TPA: protein kinase, partial [Actinomycetes bacterium]|nr:protein kinase [Actinomycetes bacterium]